MLQMTKTTTIILAAALAIGLAGAASAAEGPCRPSIDGGATCQVFVRGCEVGARLTDFSDPLERPPASASVDC